jgi:hypothetical protein
MSSFAPFASTNFEITLPLHVPRAEEDDRLATAQAEMLAEVFCKGVIPCLISLRADLPKDERFYNDHASIGYWLQELTRGQLARFAQYKSGKETPSLLDFRNLCRAFSENPPLERDTMNKTSPKYHSLFFKCNQNVKRTKQCQKNIAFLGQMLILVLCAQKDTPTTGIKISVCTPVPSAPAGPSEYSFTWRGYCPVHEKQEGAQDEACIPFELKGETSMHMFSHASTSRSGVQESLATSVVGDDLKDRLHSYVATCGLTRKNIARMNAEIMGQIEDARTVPSSGSGITDQIKISLLCDLLSSLTDIGNALSYNDQL